VTAPALPKRIFGYEGPRRTILVVDETASSTSQIADLFVPVAAERELAALWAMRAVLLGKSLDADRVLASTGRPLDD